MKKFEPTHTIKKSKLSTATHSFKEGTPVMVIAKEVKANGKMVMVIDENNKTQFVEYIQLKIIPTKK
jgi:hypothetical protein